MIPTIKAATNSLTSRLLSLALIDLTLFADMSLLALVDLPLFDSVVGALDGLEDGALEGADYLKGGRG